MCTSDASHIPFLVSELRRLRPRSVLDVGVGFGKLGVLVREYLEGWHGRASRDTWQIRLEGIEAFEAYRNPVWESVYDRVHIGDARLVARGLPGFDLVVCCDVIEHMDKASGLDLLRFFADTSGALLLTTPMSFWAQGAENGNPYEVHRSHWKPDDLRGFDGRTVELGATFGATLGRPAGAPGRLVTRKRLDDVGMRPLLRAFLRRSALVLTRRAPLPCESPS
jgi:hypothetical protein